jgi:hypothetical protein
MPSWFDRFGQEWASNGLVDDPTFAQADAGWAYIGQAPPTVEQFNSVMQWSDDKDNWLYGQIANVILKSGVQPNPNDLMQLYNAILGLFKKRLNNNLAVYVDAINGSDSIGDGTQGKPWKTINMAIYFLYNYIDPAGWNYVIQLAPGTYESVYHYLPINGAVVIQGDNLNPRAYIIKNTSGSAVGVNTATLYIQGVSVEGSGLDVDYESMGNGLYVDRGGIIVYDCIAFGPSSSCQVWIGVSGNLWPWRGASTTYTIYAGANMHIFTTLGGASTVAKMHITIQNNPSFPSGFFYPTGAGYCQIWGMTYTGTVINTRKYYINCAGQLNTAGAGGGIVPGDLPGVVDASTYGILS